MDEAADLSLDSLEIQTQPERSSSAVVPLDAIENAMTRTALAYWRMLRRGRELPARADLSPRDMRGFLSNVVLIRAIDGGADYEYRIVGETFAWAYGVQFRGMRLTEIEAAAPEHGAKMRELYEYVRQTAQPLGLQGWMGREVPHVRFIYYESVLLPLGDDGVNVDHILISTFYVPKAPD